METKVAAIYIRVSTADQSREGYSMEAQEHILRQWAATQGFNDVAVYQDPGISGKSTHNRPKFQQMLADIRAGKIECVLVWALSRLTRSVGDLYDTWGVLDAHDVGLKSYTEAFDATTITGRAMMGILGIFAQMEREMTSERVKAAMDERARQGKRTTNEVLGYDKDGKDSGINAISSLHYITGLHGFTWSISFFAAC